MSIVVRLRDGEGWPDRAGLDGRDVLRSLGLPGSPGAVGLKPLLGLLRPWLW